MKNKTLKKLLVFTLFYAGLGLFSLGQGVPPSPPTGGWDGDKPVPVTSEFVVVSIQSVGLGVKKLYDASMEYKVMHIVYVMEEWQTSFS